MTAETVLIGRTELGRFGPGNVCSAGRSSRAAELKLAFSGAVTESDIAQIAQTLVKQALEGDVAASKLILDRCLGKPDSGPLVAVQTNVTTGPKPSQTPRQMETNRVIGKVLAQGNAERAVAGMPMMNREESLAFIKATIAQSQAEHAAQGTVIRSDSPKTEDTQDHANGSGTTG